MSHATSTTAPLPPLYQNRLLNRLMWFCFGDLIQRVGAHYRRWCESLEQHSQALEQGARATVDRYQRELAELRRDRDALDTALRHIRAREQQANQRSQHLNERLQTLETEREAGREQLTRVLEDNATLQQRLHAAEREATGLRRALAEGETRGQAREQTLAEQHAKLREMLTLVDTFRQERAEAVRQRDQQERQWRTELAATRRRLQQRELELEGLRHTLQRQETLLKQRAGQPASAPGISIPLPVMRRLLQLCHPDKHNGSEAALEATRWLTAHKSQHRQRVH